MNDRELRAWAYLARVAEPPCEPVRRLVDELGVVEAATAIRARSVPANHHAVLKPTKARHVDTASFDAAAADLESAYGVGARLVTPMHSEWPGWSLLSLGRSDVALYGGEPLALWARGPARLDDIAAASIGVVGSRAATPYGERVTAILVEGLAARSWAIVSGGAFGIDGAAHRGALACGGATMAVLACGIDRDYPAGHSQLLTQIAAQGVVVSEYSPGTTAAKHRFLTRNRLVAALSSAVIVVEAGTRSGAANTAAWAHKLDRPVGAVPGPITSLTSFGCHRLIADQQAVLVADAAAAIALARPDGGGDPGRGPRRPTDDLTPDQRRVHDAIPGHGAVTIEEVAYSAGLEISQVRAALAVMEVTGLVMGDGSQWRLA